MDISFRSITSVEPLAHYLSARILGELAAGKRVLWLLAGGSAIKAAVRTSEQLQGKQLENLSVTLTDERYGEVGHPDSNWTQLQQAGFNLDGAQLFPILEGRSLDVTGKSYADNLKNLYEQTDCRIGLFGIGPDGHTAGLLPGSSAISSSELAASFEDTHTGTPNIAVKRGISRITMTINAISQLDEAVVYALGETKWPQLISLADTIDVAVQPAQALKRVPKLTIFTDMKQEGV